MLSLKRRLYRLILRLHPAAFRARFAREMSLDFEDALATYGFPRLLLDATGSLFRQWTTAPVFSATRPQAPTSSHPLLAGHYIVLEGDPLTPLELLRGTVLFALMFFTLAFALSHGGNYIRAGRNIGLGGGIGNLSQRPSAPLANAPAPAPDSSQTSIVPTSSLPSQYAMANRTGHTIYVNPATQAIGRQTESWKEFFLRCAIVSAIVWLTSFLVRRARGIGIRIAFAAAGLFAVAIAGFMPFHLADTSAHAAPLRQDNARLHFEAATIRLSKPAPPPANVSDSPKPVLALAGEPEMRNSDRIHITSPIRFLIASASGMPESRIVGGPAWLWLDTYDIQAKIGQPLFSDMQQMSPGQQQYQIHLMEQSLLVTRFHLKAHEETRTLPASQLAPAQSPVQVLVIDSIDRPSEN
jgi:hypothetical protein